MKSDDHKLKPPALLFGGGLTLLSVVRALGRRGIPVYCAEVQPPPNCWSRWYRIAQSNTGDPTPRNLTAYLRSLPFEQAVLFPCSDHWLAAIVAGLEENPDLQNRFPTSLPGSKTVATFTDKAHFANLLQELALPHPRTLVIDDENALTEVDATFFSHAFLKPADSQRFGEIFHCKAFTVNSVDEALSRYRQAKEAGLSLLLQERIPGPPTHHYFIDGFVDRHGTLAALFARQRLRMYPPDFGNSSYLVTVSLETVQQGIRSLEKLLSSVQYRGIFSAEFKFDARDGQFKLLEVNARPWWYLGFAADCGIDVASLAYRDALGLDVGQQKSYPVGVHFVYAEYDAPACSPAISPPGLSDWQRYRQWLKARQAVFAWDDLSPSLHQWKDRLVGKVQRIFRKPRVR